MQDVGEHMDDLFRKAADNYMLKEGESNWNKISGQLEFTVVSPVLPVNKNNHARKYLITLSLLLLCFAAGVLFNSYESNRNRGVINKEYQNKGASAGKLNKDILQPDEKLQGDKLAKNNKIEKAGINSTNNSNVSSSDNFYKKNDLLPVTGVENNMEHFDNRATLFKDLSISPATKSNSTLTTNKSPESIAVLNNKVVAIPQLSPKDSSAGNTTIKLTVKNKPGMYYGLLAGAGFTTVKSQSFTKPGFDIGLVAGYQFLSRSSVEINVLYTHKYYYSDGKYFSMDKMKNDMPADMKLMSVKGNSSIIEIPVKFRYNIIQKNNSGVYAAAGISSYILVNEKNNYVTSVNGTMGNMYGNYTSTSTYFAGAFNISAGYAHATGKNNTIRVEPFVSIPLKGIGMGSLPVTTSGVHVLFTIVAHK